MGGVLSRWRRRRRSTHSPNPNPSTSSVSQASTADAAVSSTSENSSTTMTSNSNSTSSNSSGSSSNTGYVVAAPTPYPNTQQHHPHNVHHNVHSQNENTQNCAPRVVEHQKAITIRNDVNLKKDSVRFERDGDHPGQFLLQFSFDANVPGSISIFFFAKEGPYCGLTSLRADTIKPVRVHFEQGLGQSFRQPSGTGINLSEFDEEELTKDGPEVIPLAIRAESSLNGDAESQTLESDEIGCPLPTSVNSQITQAVIEKKESGDYAVRVLRQILWVNGTRYELQEIYGIGNSVGSDVDGDDPGKECVICMTEPRDTTILPCRHMCLCSDCAKVLRLQTNRCPICRRSVERLLEIKVNKPES